MERFLRYDQICVEKLPLMKIRKKQAKKGNLLISASEYQKYTKFTSRHMFSWMMNAMQLVKKNVAYHQRRLIKNGHQSWLKIVFGISKQQDT